jgi:hypothetical protein
VLIVPSDWTVAKVGAPSKVISVPEAGADTPEAARETRMFCIEVNERTLQVTQASKKQFVETDAGFQLSKNPAGKSTKSRQYLQAR